MRCFLFSGQGSHFRGMGRELFNWQPQFTQAIEEFDAIIYRETGHRLIDQLYQESNKHKAFRQVLITHPAIVSIELAMLRVMNANGVYPDIVMGNSLGEFSAAVAAGIWDEQQAILTAIEQAKALLSVPEGGMTAVLHQRNEKYTQLIEANGLHTASDNFTDHFTVAGKLAALESFEKVLDSDSITYQRLDVPYAFHSPSIDAAENNFENFSNSLKFNPAKTGCIFYSSFLNDSITQTPEPQHFWKAVREYSDLTQSFATLYRDYDVRQFIDLGPSGTLSTFAKYALSNNPDVESVSILSMFKGDRERLQKFLAA